MFPLTRPPGKPNRSGMIRILMTGLAAAALAACTTLPPQASSGPLPTGDPIDRLARDYLLLQLTIGEKDPGYIDAYYGPGEYSARAKADAAGADLAGLTARVEALQARLAAISVMAGSPEARRLGFLAAQLTAAHTRLRMLQGEKLSFQDEAEGLFAIRPELADLKQFDAALAELEDIIPGEGDLGERRQAFADQFNIPPARLRTVMDAAIAECRRRTLEHIDIPAGEKFDLALVTDKPWGGYNYYQGGYHSLIEVNTDLPRGLSSALDVGCHEAYPGHHVYSSLIEKKLVRERGWIEFSALPLYSPQALVAEGSASFGVDLAFPGDEDLIFERDVLAPLAGIDASQLAAYHAMTARTASLSGASYTIAAAYLAGEIDADEAARLGAKYGLTTVERARAGLKFYDTYRSYTVNYGLGKQLIRAAVEAAGASEEARWDRFEEIISEPTLPGDLTQR